MSVLHDAIDKYGPDMQKTVAIEECSEVIKEICKMQRGNYNKLHMAEEIADLEIMIAQLEIMCGKSETCKEIVEPSFSEIVNSISYLQMCIADSMISRVGNTEVNVQLKEVEKMLEYLTNKLDIEKLVEVYTLRKINRLAEIITYKNNK